MLFGMLPEQVSGQALSSAASASVCNYKKFRGRIASAHPNLYKDIPNNEIENLAPHHLVPRTDNRSYYCLKNGSNNCQRARDILSEAGIDIDDPSNGVLLPWRHKRANDTEKEKVYEVFDSTYEFAKPHASGGNEVHSANSYDEVRRRLDEIRANYPSGELLPAEKDSLKQAIQKRLAETASDMLHGDFLKQTTP